jgi:hypothetical protein
LPNPPPIISNYLYLTPGSFYFFSGAIADGMYFDCQGPIDLPLGEKFNTAPLALDQAGLDQCPFIDGSAAFETSQIIDVDNDDCLFKNVGKSAFGQPAVYGHLPALITGS